MLPDQDFGLWCYLIGVAITATWTFDGVRGSAWCAPRWVVFAVSAIAGLLWFVVLPALGVAWVLGRRRG